MPPRPAAAVPSPPTRGTPRPWRRLALAFALGSAAALAGGVALVRLAAPPPPPPAAVPPGPSPTAVTELPRPASARPEAVAAFVAGLQAMRDGSGAAAAVRFQEALDKDPDLAVAHLRLAFSKISSRPVEARAHHRRAAELRHLLGDRDQALLDAIDPLILRQPADFAEGSRRLAAALARYPGDAELALYHAMALGDLRQAVVALDGALALDPRFALALWMKAQRLAYLGEIEQALAAIARCLEVSPRANECRELRVWIDQEGGQCARVAEDARAMAAVSAESADAWRYLAGALAASGSARESVEEALRKHRDRLPEAERREAELWDGARVSLLYGDFEGAEQTARELASLVAPRAVAADHARPMRLLVELYLETSRVADAADVAGDYLKRRDAWEQDARAEDFAMAKDPTAFMLLAQRRAGRLSQREFEDRRDEWLRGWESRAVASARNYLWLHHYAAVVETPEDARAALLSLPRFTPQPRFRPFTPADAWVGATYWLGDRREEALPVLRRAAGACLVLEHPVAQTRAQLMLGLALEAAGEREGACAALGVVRDRWGRAKPRSVSAGVAEARMRGMGCR